MHQYEDADGKHQQPQLRIVQREFCPSYSLLSWERPGIAPSFRPIRLIKADRFPEPLALGSLADFMEWIVFTGNIEFLEKKRAESEHEEHETEEESSGSEESSDSHRA